MIVSNFMTVSAGDIDAADSEAYGDRSYVDVPNAHAILCGTRDKWLQLRRAGIGASDIGAITGVDPFRGPIEVYESKIKPPEPGAMSGPARNGLRLEYSILEIMAEETGIPLFTPSEAGSQVIYTAYDNPRAFCTNDGFCIEAGQLGNVQVKSVGKHMAPEWADDQIPAKYFAQIQHEMRVTGLEYTYIPAFFTIDDIRIYRVEADPGTFQAIDEIISTFWAYVEAGTPPPPTDGNRNTQQAIARVCEPPEPGRVEYLPVDFDAMHERRAELAESIRKQTAEKNLIDTKLKYEIGTRRADVVVTANGAGAYTWKEQKNGRVLREAKIPKGY